MLIEVLAANVCRCQISRRELASIGRCVRLLGTQNHAAGTVRKHFVAQIAKLCKRLVSINAANTKATQLRDCVLYVLRFALANKHLKLVDHQRHGRAGLVGARPTVCRSHHRLQQQHTNKLRNPAKRAVRQWHNHNPALFHAAQKINGWLRLREQIPRRFINHQVIETPKQRIAAGFLLVANFGECHFPKVLHLDIRAAWQYGRPVRLVLNRLFERCKRWVFHCFSNKRRTHLRVLLHSLALAPGFGVEPCKQRKDHADCLRHAACRGCINAVQRIHANWPLCIEHVYNHKPPLILARNIG